MVQFTDQQLAIIKAPPDQNIYVNACPGSGKTTTIIGRVKYLIEIGIPQEKIGLFTYNRSLGEDIKKKLGNLTLGHSGTVHSWCYRDTRDKEDLSLWLDLHQDDEETPFTHLIFDEYQDATREIASVIKKLIGNGWLTIVGDDRQQLYTSMGADCSYLYQIEPNFVPYHLTISFRCPQPHLDFLNRLSPDYPSMKGVKTGNKIQYHRLKSNQMRDPIIIKAIVAIIEEFKGCTFAVISPVCNTDKSKKFLGEIKTNIEKKIPEYQDKISLNDKNKNLDNSISSINKVKGKEYDLVFVINCFDAHYTFKDGDQDSLCKIFVACSRAKKELVIFENIIYEEDNFTLRWFFDNKEHLEIINYSSSKEMKLRNKPYRETNRLSVTRYIETLSFRQKNEILNRYKPRQLIDQESGVVIDNDPMLCGKLLEILLAVKFFEYKPCIYDRFIIEDGEIKDDQEISDSVKEKIRMRFGDVKYEIVNKDLIEIDGCPVIIDIYTPIINDLYYKHLPTIKETTEQITDELTKDNIQKIWSLVKFNTFCDTWDSDYINKDEELADSSIAKIINYINQANIISKLGLSKYQKAVNGKIKEKEIKGIIDFTTTDGILEIKYVSGSLNNAWLQVIIYNDLSNPKYNYGYVYNARDGKLYKRNL